MNIRAKKWLAVLLCAALFCAVIPHSLSAEAAYTHIYDQTFTANGKTVPLPDLPLDMVFENCFEFAQAAYTEIWGQDFSEFLDSEEDMLRGMESDDRLLTEENLKAFVMAAEIGAVMRLCRADCLYGGDLEGHNQIILQKDEEGFTVYEGNIGWNGVISIAYYNWDTYIKLWPQYDYIKYVKWPGAPEFHEAYATQVSTCAGEYRAVGTANRDCRIYTLPWVSETALLERGTDLQRGTSLAVTRLLRTEDGKFWFAVENEDGSTGYVLRDQVSVPGLENCTVTELMEDGLFLQQAELYDAPGGGKSLGSMMMGQSATVLCGVVTPEGENWLEVLTKGGTVGYVSAEETVMIGASCRYEAKSAVLVMSAPRRSAELQRYLWEGDKVTVTGMLYDSTGRLWLQLYTGGYVAADRMERVIPPPLPNRTRPVGDS